ncbi:TraB/GumN family protein [Fusibacter sp. JL298sf-3]
MKKIGSLLLSLVLIFSVVPAFAADVEVSPWAVAELNEVERYGIHKIDWYTQGFLGEVKAEELAYIQEGFFYRLEEAGVKADEAYAFTAIEAPYTREDVVTLYYDILKAHGLAGADDSVEALKARQVLKGTAAGLDLDAVCSTQEAVIMGKRLLENVIRELDKDAKGLLWKVSKDDVTVYMLGSIHAANYKTYPMDEEVMQAFGEADALVVEALMGPEQIAAFQEVMVYSGDETIKDYISEETYAKLDTVLQKYGQTAQQVEKVKVWNIINSLSSVLNAEQSGAENAKASVGAQLAIDTYFMNTANLMGKPVVELEGLVKQAGFFDTLSQEGNEKRLNEVLDALLTPESAEEEGENSGDLITQWLAYWQAGDEKAFTESFQASQGTDEVSNMLFGERDVYMASRIDELLKSGEEATYFVMVGAGHYTGKASILKNLTEMGYEVESLNQ